MKIRTDFVTNSSSSSYCVSLVVKTSANKELGLDFSSENFIEFDSGCDGYDCYKMYFVNKDIDINDVVIQKEELSEVKWFSMEKLKEMVDKKELNEDQISCFVKVCDYLEKTKKD